MLCNIILPLLHFSFHLRFSKKYILKLNCSNFPSHFLFGWGLFSSRVLKKGLMERILWVLDGQNLWWFSYLKDRGWIPWFCRSSLWQLNSSLHLRWILFGRLSCPSPSQEMCLIVWAQDSFLTLPRDTIFVLFCFSFTLPQATVSLYLCPLDSVWWPTVIGFYSVGNKSPRGYVCLLKQ